MVDLFARYNLAAPLPAELVELAGRHAERVVVALAPPVRDRASAEVQTLVLCHVAERVARQLADAHLPAPLAPPAERALAADHAVAALHALASGDAGLRARLVATAKFLQELAAPSLARLPHTARALGVRLARPGLVPIETLLARSYPHSFDREGTRILPALPRARVCTLRTVEAPEGSLAAVSADGHLWLATPRALRDVPASGAEVGRALDGPLRAGTLLFAGSTLTHLTVFPERVEASLFSLTPAAAVRQGVIVVRGSAFLEGGGALRPAAPLPAATAASPAPPGIVVVRRAPSGYEEIAVDLAARRARRIGAVPGATGHRDGQLGEARFLPGPFTALPSGARVFFDPAAQALRIAEKGFLGTIFTGPARKDGVGAEGGVGHITGLAADSRERIYFAERGRPEAGLRRYHLRMVLLRGGACPR